MKQLLLKELKDKLKLKMVLLFLKGEEKNDPH